MQQVLPPSGKTGLETRLASGFANLFISIYGSKAIGIPIVTATPGWQQLTLPDGSALLLIKYDLSLSAIIIQHCAWSSAPSAPARSNLPGEKPGGDSRQACYYYVSVWYFCIWLKFCLLTLYIFLRPLFAPSTPLNPGSQSAQAARHCRHSHTCTR